MFCLAVRSLAAHAIRALDADIYTRYIDIYATCAFTDAQAQAGSKGGQDEAKEAKTGGGIALSGKLGTVGAGAKGLTSAAQLKDLRDAIQKLCQSANPLGKCMGACAGTEWP